MEQRAIVAPGSVPLKNPSHEKFSREIAAGASLADAWRELGRDPATGNQSRLARRPEIQARIEYLREEFNKHAGLSLAAIQARLLRIADCNIPADFFSIDPTTKRLCLRDLTALPRTLTAPISELHVDGDGAVRVKVADKLSAIGHLLKTIGLDKDQKPGTTWEDLVMASMEQQRQTRIDLRVVTGVPRAPDEPAESSSNRADPAKSAATIWA